MLGGGQAGTLQQWQFPKNVLLSPSLSLRQHHILARGRAQSRVTCAERGQHCSARAVPSTTALPSCSEQGNVPAAIPALGSSRPGYSQEGSVLFAEVMWGRGTRRPVPLR